ncbi:MAG: nickel/cobalt transporter [Pseudomonas marincola]
MSRQLVLFSMACCTALIGLLVSDAAAAPAITEPTLWTELIHWIAIQQRSLHQELVAALKMVKNEGSMAAAGSLIVGSFLYGLFHAAGPGHGKAVLATYLLTHPHRVGRGVGIAAMGALCQGIVAVILVYGLIYLAGWLPRETSAAISWSERLSYILVAAIGVILILRILRKAIRQFFSKGLGPASHNHNDDACGDCGHTHVPNEKQLDRAIGFFSSFGVVLAIGLRPCTGAVLVLVFAKAIGIPYSGVCAVLAMSAGTSIAVAVLAFLAVKFRNKAVSLIDSRSPLWWIAANGAILAGGGLLLVLGISLLNASFYARHPLGL